MSNLFTEFKKLVPDSPLLVGTIDSIADGIAVIELPDGSIFNARGFGAVDDMVFVRNGLIEGPAPALTVVEILV